MDRIGKRSAVRRSMLALIVALVAIQSPPARAAARLDEAAVRDFVARQEAAWNARDANAYFALFAPNAVFVDQAESSQGGVIAYGSSTLAEAQRHAGRYFRNNRSVDRTTIQAITLAPDRRSARVVGRKVTVVHSRARSTRHCAITEQTVTLAGGRLVSLGQTDTAVRCRDFAR